MNHRTILGVAAACMFGASLSGCGQKAKTEAVAPAVEAAPTAPSAEVESALINKQPSPDAALTQQQRYQKELESDAAMRAKQKNLCHGQESLAGNLAPELQRPCQALADAEFALTVKQMQSGGGVKNTNSL